MLSFPDYPLFEPGLLTEPTTKHVSAVVATYNRAPYPVDGPDADLNPLDFCLRAMSEQRLSPLLEVIVVDDASSDHTRAVVERWRPRFAQLGVDVVYHHNPRRLDAHAARNVGSELARGRWIYVVDDDSVMPPHALAGACAYFERTRAIAPALAALALPVYQRATAPLMQRPSAQIGTLDRERGEARGAFDSFPSEWAAGQVEYLDEARRFLLPVAVENLCGAHALLDRARMLEVGGFPALPTRGYGGETGLALALLRRGYELRYAPDPRLHAVHLRYGNPRSAALKGGDWRSHLGLDGPSLEQMVACSAQARSDTGCRVSSAVWYYARIRNNLWLMREHDPALEARYRAYAEQAFVEQGRLGDVVEPLAKRRDRERVFRLAEADSRTLPEQSLAELEARLATPPISAVLLNYKRPKNVAAIVARLKECPLIDDITVWNNDASTVLEPTGDFAGVTVINASSNSLLARYAAALLARHETVLVQDDDVIVPNDTLAALYCRFVDDPDVVHGLFGRDPKPDGSYALDRNQVDAAVDVVLTRCLLVHRKHLAAFFAELAPFGLEDADPPGNGEDILLSYVARKATGRKNRVYALPVEELPAPHAVHRRPNHRQHRSQLMKRCLAWAGISAPASGTRNGPGAEIDHG